MRKRLSPKIFLQHLFLLLLGGILLFSCSRKDTLTIYADPWLQGPAHDWSRRHGDGVPCDPPPRVGLTVTWETTRGELDEGLCYTVSSSANQAVTTNAVAIGEANTPNQSVGLNPNTTGPIGAFDNSHDIGAVNFQGSTTFDGDVYTVSGSGGDIWAGGMNGHYAYKAVTGDFVATTRVRSVTNERDARRNVALRLQAAKWE